MFHLIRKASLVTVACAVAVSLAACEEAIPDQEPEGRYSVTLAPGTQTEMIDGPMASVNACIERNSTEHFDAEAARTACIWAHSVPFSGMPPGVTGHLAYGYPESAVTLRNNNAMIMITEVCIRVQLNVQNVIPRVCGKITVSPMESTTAMIMMRSELDALGINEEFTPRLDAFQWEVVSVRYIQLLEPADQE